MTEMVDITPAYVTFNDANFDTRARYLRQITSASAFGLVSGPTWLLTATGSGPYGAYGVGNRRSTFLTPPTNTIKKIDVGSAAGTAGTSVDISPSGISIQDATTGRKLHDPSIPIMHVVDQVSGSRSFPTPNGQGQAYNVNTDTVIAAVDPVCTDVIGSVNVVYDPSFAVVSTSTGAGGTDWWSINGTFIVYFSLGTIGSGQAAGQVINGSPSRIVAWSSLTFKVVSGQIIMTEVTSIAPLFAGGQFNPEGGGSVGAYVRPSFTLNYRLKACVFS